MTSFGGLKLFRPPSCGYENLEIIIINMVLLISYHEND